MDTNQSHFILDTSKSLPTDKEVFEMFSQIKYTIKSSTSRFLEQVIAMNSGDYVFTEFQFEYHPILDFFASRGRLDEINFFNLFFSKKDVNSIITNQENNQTGDIDCDFKRVSSYCIDGYIAQFLANSVYSKYKGTIKESKIEAIHYCNELFNEEYEHIDCYESSSAWSSWFDENDIIKYSLLFIARNKRKMWLMTMRDND